MFEFEKIVMMINWFSRQCYGKTINKLDLLKMIYMADRYHLRRFGRLISGDTYYAMRLGPVPSISKAICDNPQNLTEEQKTFAYDFIQILEGEVHSLKSSEKNYFCPSELEALNAARIKALLVKQSGETLPDFTHKFPEWKAYEKYLKSEKSCRKIDTLKFFCEIVENRDIIEYCPTNLRLLKSNKQKFIERQAIEKLIGNING